jgi:hypothetical protein
MDIQTFFAQSAGKWFAHRTSHHLVHPQSQGEKSTLFIDLLSSSDAAATELCQAYDVTATDAIATAKITWEPVTDQLQPPRRNWGGVQQAEPEPEAAILVLLTPESGSNQGKLLRSLTQGKNTMVGRYQLGDDDALTLITESDDLYAEERIWFAGENLRLRTSLLKRADGFTLASFCTEIRMGVAPPAQG